MTYTVFGMHGCNFCTKAMDHLNARGDDVEFVNVVTDVEKQAEFRELMESAGAAITTAPQIFVFDEGVASHIGGYSDLVAHHS